jgi:hypothetical protein
MVFQKTAALTMVQTNQWQWVNGSKAPAQSTAPVA